MPSGNRFGAHTVSLTPRSSLWEETIGSVVRRGRPRIKRRFGRVCADRGATKAARSTYGFRPGISRRPASSTLRWSFSKLTFVTTPSPWGSPRCTVRSPVAERRRETFRACYPSCELHWPFNKTIQESSRGAFFEFARVACSSTTSRTPVYDEVLRFQDHAERAEATIRSNGRSWHCSRWTSDLLSGRLQGDTGEPGRSSGCPSELAKAAAQRRPTIERRRFARTIEGTSAGWRTRTPQIHRQVVALAEDC